ncbi:MAG: hypothetical protein ACC652_04720 [Acidimicrobiales bacterium]
MFLWFLGLSFLGVFVVFRDPAIDHRMVMLGAVAPIAVDLVTPGYAPAHTLLGAVLLLGFVMVATHGRRHLRRRLIGFSIGVFFHLILDLTWTREVLFWWPLLGTKVDTPGFGAYDRPIYLLAIMELVGAAVLYWAYRRFNLSDARLREDFMRTGHLDRELMGPGEPPSC